MSVFVRFVKAGIDTLYFRDAQERMQDVPFCPPPEEMFKPKRQNQSEEDEEEDTLTGPSEM